MKKINIEGIFRTLFIQHVNSLGLKEHSFLPAFAGKKGRKNTGLYFYLKQVGGHGWQGRKYNYENGLGHTEEQVIEWEMRITAISSNQDHNPNDMTVDALMVVQSLPFTEDLRKKGIGSQRPSKITTVTFVNDSDNYEEESFFTLRLSTIKTINPPTKPVTQFTSTLKQV